MASEIIVRRWLGGGFFAVALAVRLLNAPYIFDTAGNYLGSWDAAHDTFADIHSAFYGQDAQGEYLIIVDRDSNEVARTTLGALDATEGTICVPAGSCATMIRVFWPELFEMTGDHDARERAGRVGARVREFSELIADREVGETIGGKVAYHHSCHMLRELGIPSVVCGPGSIAVAHKPDEYVGEDQLKACDDMLARLLERLAE